MEEQIAAMKAALRTGGQTQVHQAVQYVNPSLQNDGTTAVLLQIPKTTFKLLGSQYLVQIESCHQKEADKIH